MIGILFGDGEEKRLADKERRKEIELQLREEQKRIETALKPCVENSNSAALRMASRIFGLRDMGLRSVLCFCTVVQIIRSSQQIYGLIAKTGPAAKWEPVKEANIKVQ